MHGAMRWCIARGAAAAVEYRPVRPRPRGGVSRLCFAFLQAAAPARTVRRGGGPMGFSMSHLPPLPEIGHPESYYARLAKQAEHDGDIHAHEAAKVGQYITLALDPNLDWDTKRRYFRHALRRHCAPPQVSSELVDMYYQRLVDLVMHHAGAEALRLASSEDDKYACRLAGGEQRRRIMEDALEFF